MVVFFVKYYIIGCNEWWVSNKNDDKQLAKQAEF
jgi:hypothetical protein